jgi:N-acetylneuraminate synthase
MSIKVVAEIGINHNGQIETALEMIQQAHRAGATAVKFQKRTVEVVYRGQLDKPRDDGNPYGWKTYREQKNGLEFGRKQYDAIDAECKRLGMLWFASAWDLDSLAFLEVYDPPFSKIASAMLTEYDFVEAVAMGRRPTFISTGGSTMGDIEDAVDVFERWDTDYILMHCVSLYPCPDEQCNLLMIPKLKAKFGGNDHCLGIGYSGHEVGILPSIHAMALGATWIERHFTLDRSMYGSDQSASMEYPGLARLCEYARMTPAILGDGCKVVCADEECVMGKLRYWK